MFVSCVFVLLLMLSVVADVDVVVQTVTKEMDEVRKRVRDIRINFKPRIVRVLIICQTYMRTTRVERHVISHLLSRI